MDQKPPTLGRVVLYTLTEGDAAQINKRRKDFAAFQKTIFGNSPAPGELGATGHVGHVGNLATVGDVCPAMVVRIWGTCCNLQVLLDGTDTFWATSRSEGDKPGSWAWPPRV